MHAAQMRLLFLGLAVIGITSRAVGGPEPAEPPVLVRVTTTDNRGILGELIAEGGGRVQILDLRTGKTESIARNSIDSLRRGITDEQAVAAVGMPTVVAWKTKRSLLASSTTGKVAKTADAHVFVTLGSRQGIRTGDELVAYHEGEELRDPGSGESLGKVKQTVRLNVTEVNEKFCIAAKAEGALEALTKGDIVVHTPKTRRVAVLPLVDLAGKERESGKRLAEAITASLVNQGVPVVERALIEKVLGELERQQGAAFDAEHAEKLGKVLGAQTVLLGTLSEKGKGLDAQVRAIRVESGQIVFVVRGRLQSDLGSEVTPAKKAPQARVRRSDSFVNSIGMKMVLIPAGDFMMGSPESEKDRYRDEGPQHKVRITKPFYLGVYEVTQEQYEKVMGSNPSNFHGANRPVERVSWDDAVKFCEKLGQLERKTYRLPTEAEWEYACRAGSTTRFCFGDDDSLLEEYAWNDKNSGSQTQKVGQKRPNPWGLYDIHGNIWEWCSDWYGQEYYGESPTEDPKGSLSGSLRVLRGGSFFMRRGDMCRSANRDALMAGGRTNNVGFRAAMTE